jgi:hypothetical protein
VKAGRRQAGNLIKIRLSDQMLGARTCLRSVLIRAPGECRAMPKLPRKKEEWEIRRTSRPGVLFFRHPARVLVSRHINEITHT